MRCHLAVPLALLFIAFGVPSNAQSNAGDEARVSVDEGAPLTVECALRVEERADWKLDGGAVPGDLRSADPVETTTAAAAVAPVSAAESSAGGSSHIIQYYLVSTTFMLNCTTARVADAGSYVWKKNGTVVEEVWDLRQRYKLEEGGAVFRMSERTNENDFGNYSCFVGTDSTPVLMWDVRGRPIAKMPPNANVVEKQSIKLTCKIMGKPYPTVEWTVTNTTEEKVGVDVKAVLGERVKIQDSEQGVENGELVLSEAERSDAGVYKCTPLGVKDAVAASTTLRVKDQYAALWPFLGICAEVFVLCAIILVYEKRRTKPELDDSDTDNHDQKKS